MIKQYINDNEFDRTQLALDIKNGKISAGKLDAILKQIDEAVDSGNIQSPYIGSSYGNKRKKTDWNSRYLDYLVAEVSSSEVFNKESITYLLTVAKYVNSAGLRAVKKTVFVLVCGCVVFAAGLFTGKTEITKLKKENEDLARKVVQLKEDNNDLITEKEKLDNSVNDVIIAASEFENKYNELKKKLDSIKSQIETNSFDEKKNELITTIEKLNLDNTPNKSIPNKDMPEVSEASKADEPSANEIQPEENELDKFINRALNGENVKLEFQDTDYSSKDVEARALERKLNRKDAEKLVKNLVNPNKFDVNKFGE